MLEECCNCKTKITFLEYYKQFLRNRYRYVCKECGTIYKATNFSIILNVIIVVTFLVYGGIKNLYLFNIIWILMWGFALQPFILSYKVMDTNKDS